MKQHRLNLRPFLQETTTHLATTKHQYIKQFELTKELLLISLTQLLEASTELVLFSHKFNPNLNIIALADVSLGQGRQEANKICPIDSEQLDLTGSCYLCPISWQADLEPCKIQSGCVPEGQPPTAISLPLPAEVSINITHVSIS